MSTCEKGKQYQLEKNGANGDMIWPYAAKQSKNILARRKALWQQITRRLAVSASYNP